MPLVTLFLVAANVLVYLTAGGQAACEQFGLIPAHFIHGGSFEPLFTSLFFHDPSDLSHIAGNMAFLALFGTLVERAIGGARFTALYLASGVAGGLLHCFVSPAATEPLVGASGCLFGVLAVAGAIYPRLLGFVVAFVGINLFHTFFGGAGTVSCACHLGGFALGVVVVLTLRVTNSETLETA